MTGARKRAEYRIRSVDPERPAFVCVPLDGGAGGEGDEGAERDESGDGGEREERGEGDPVLVRADGYEGALADDVSALEPGNCIGATVEWTDGTARFSDVEVLEDSRISYVRGATGLFEVALDVMEEARREGAGVNSRTTYSTDGEPNGAVYAFADQPGERDLLAEFREGVAPLEPLLARLDEFEDCPHHVFVLDPLEHDFLVVYLVLRTDGVLARTVADTYD